MLLKVSQRAVFGCEVHCGHSDRLGFKACNACHGTTSQAGAQSLCSHPCPYHPGNCTLKAMLAPQDSEMSQHVRSYTCIVSCKVSWLKEEMRSFL